MQKGYVRIEKCYDVDFILNEFISFTQSKKEKRKENLDGDFVGCNSLRLQTFKLKGTKCTTCGIVGSKFYKEKDQAQPTYHLNLYAIDVNGKEILMTKDHIIHKSKGGKDHLDNLQPMCFPCNFKKGNGDVV